MKPKTREAELEHLLAFRPCPSCTYDLATGDGQRACHYADCPYLPEALDPRCPVCLYNFHADDLVPACGDPPTCEFARREAPWRLEALAFWLQHQGSG